MLKDYGSFVLDKEKEPEMTKFNQVSESYAGKSKATNCWTDPISSNFKKYLKCTLFQSLPLL